MLFHLRKRFRLGPVIFNVTEHGWTSTTFKVGPFSYNTGTGRRSVDLPGPVNYRSRPRRRRPGGAR